MGQDLLTVCHLSSWKYPPKQLSDCFKNKKDQRDSTAESINAPRIPCWRLQQLRLELRPRRNGVDSISSVMPRRPRTVRRELGTMAIKGGKQIAGMELEDGWQGLPMVLFDCSIMMYSWFSVTKSRNFNDWNSYKPLLDGILELLAVCSLPWLKFRSCAVQVPKTYPRITSWNRAGTEVLGCDKISMAKTHPELKTSREQTKLNKYVNSTEMCWLQGPTKRWAVD